MPAPIKVELLPHDPDWSRLANAEAWLLSGLACGEHRRTAIPWI